ncbi:MAG TPA: NAD(P)-dependent oxidoreductase [Chromobacteriaceae bacterium]|nr:NAD(P)-dependent oxidoreductase [Chromobacteriaceae bacterium]
MERIGFIGLGLMGQPMVRRLLASGLSVNVWNRSSDKIAALATSGAHGMPSIAELVRQSDVLMLCVSDTAAVEDVVFAEHGIIHHARAGQLLVDFSSIAPEATRSFALRLQQHCGVTWVDAPVSGGVVGAESGKLVIMAGGEAADIERLRPLTTPLAQKLTHMGPVGSGQVTKVCNQLIVAANAMLIAEAVSLAEKNGVNANLLAPALAGGFADSLPLQILAPRMAERSHQPVQWKVATLLKDLDNAMTLAKSSEASSPLAALATQLMRLHAHQGHGSEDLSTVIQLYGDA